MAPSAAPVGVGYAAPDTIVGNDAIAARLGVDEEWIERRTGTRERRVAGPGERLEDFATRAAADALSRAGVDASDVDVVLVATTSADEMSPHTAPLVAGNIGAGGAAAIDVSSACVGFLSSLVMGAAMIESGRAGTVVAIGADMLSRYLDPDDPQSAMLFGDGAGAVVITASDGDGGIGPSVFSSDPDGRRLIRLDRQELLIRMDGHAVYRRAVEMMAGVTRQVLDRSKFDIEDVDLFVYHQANGRIIRAVGERLGLDGARVVNVVDRFANTSAASLPIALGVAAEEDRLHAGSRVFLAAFGAGLVWGGAMLTWGR